MDIRRDENFGYGHFKKMIKSTIENCFLFDVAVENCFFEYVLSEFVVFLRKVDRDLNCLCKTLKDYFICSSVWRNNLKFMRDLGIFD